MSRVRRLINSNVQDIIKSPELIILMLRTYSDLYAGGCQVSTCEKSIQKYYNQLKIDGMEKEKKFNEAKERTLVPSWNGLLYITGNQNKHFNSATITDKEAVELLKLGYLQEKMFKKLPDAILTKKAKKDETFKSRNTKSSKRKTGQVDKKD